MRSTLKKGEPWRVMRVERVERRGMIRMRLPLPGLLGTATNPRLQVKESSIVVSLAIIIYERDLPSQ